jgi:hypothetical protein
MTDLSALFSPGMLVRHPNCPDWGTGQIQSCIGTRITVTFPEAGKVVIDAALIPLIIVQP